MGSTSSVDKKKGMTQLVDNEVLTVSGGSGSTNIGSATGPSSMNEDKNEQQRGGGTVGGDGAARQSGAAVPKPLLIRRKNPSGKRGHTREGSNGSNSGGPTATNNSTTTSSPNLYKGDGPITAWKKGSLVGKGATGSVFQATDVSSGTIFCVKEIQFADDFADNPHDMQRFEALRREIELLKDIHHTNVVRFLGVDRQNYVIYIQMEYVFGGNIQEIVRNFGALGEDTAGKFTLQILEGLDYLHDKNIIHRDIKGANILVGVNGEVKLADFGAAKRVLDSDELFKTLAGTPYWMAPEVVRQEGHNKAADIWSLGATVLQMLTGAAPYQGLAPVPALFKIGHSTESPVPAEMPNVSEGAVEFIRYCLAREPAQRPTVKQLLSHRWIQRHRTIREEKKLSATRRKMTVVVDEPTLTAANQQTAQQPARRGPLSSAVSMCSDAEMLVQNAEYIENDNADEEYQIQEFVAYVSERHRTLQGEQQSRHCAEAIEVVVDVPKAVKRYDSPPSSPGSVDSLGNPREEVFVPPLPPPVPPQPTNPMTSSHRLEDDDDEDGSLPPIGSTHPPNATSPAAKHNERRGHATMTVVEHPDEEEDGGDDVAFEDEFDEAHFDEIIAGLGDVRTV
ncbi:protein kinase, putative [Bodo saltans]|uniref:Protein kinase, putative n=1 Tax=Bodo saltans TaxID=75058 RepID=A0A0S4J575_BODSA|nr:protein kinase, putative [Bodo saltans]|eukprot:CUG84671.1 protein kinase, putative [Bodo saltans]